jgi:hypothetical protein
MRPSFPISFFRRHIDRLGLDAAAAVEHGLWWSSQAAAADCRVWKRRRWWRRGKRRQSIWVGLDLVFSHQTGELWEFLFSARCVGFRADAHLCAYPAVWRAGPNSFTLLIQSFVSGEFFLDRSFRNLFDVQILKNRSNSKNRSEPKMFKFKFVQNKKCSKLKLFKFENVQN